MGVALMPAIFDAPNVKKVPVRDFDAKRVISLHWNEDVADDRRDRVVAFATTHNWAIIRSGSRRGPCASTPESGPAATLTRSTHALHRSHCPGRAHQSQPPPRL
jgi:hypothetical protein